MPPRTSFPIVFSPGLAPAPWPRVLVDGAWDVLIAVVLALAGLVPGAVVGALLGGWLGMFWGAAWGMAVMGVCGVLVMLMHWRRTVRHQRALRVAMEAQPFVDAAWESFLAWIVSGGARQARAEGFGEALWVVPWVVEGGAAVSRYGPFLRPVDLGASGASGLEHRPRARPRVAWIPAEAAVPDALACRRYARAGTRHMSVAIGPFPVGNAHAVLRLEALASYAGSVVTPAYSVAEPTPSA